MLVAAVALAGCNSEPKDEPDEEQAIRAWSKAVNAERYRLAASFFAEGAIVEQGR